jgi:ADP-ribose pyrophosphatase YjhB (NUDIX family)
MSFRIGVFAIILDGQERVLLCHRRDYDLWNLPGGGLEAGEAPWQGVIREVKEETGLDAQVLRLAGVYSKPNVDEVVFSFVCAVVSGSIAVTDEADRAEFFELDSLPPNTIPKQVERIRDALDQPDRVVMKVQRGRSAIELVREGKL